MKCDQCRRCPHNGLNCFRMELDGHGHCSNADEFLGYFAEKLKGNKHNDYVEEGSNNDS